MRISVKKPLMRYVRYSRRRTKWILGNVENNYRNMTDYVNRQVES